MKATVVLHRDGTFDIQAGALQLLHARPAIDNRPISPIRAEVLDSLVVYHMPDGKLTLSFSETPEGLELKTTLEGFATAPHWLHPVAFAEIQGADRLFRTGIGFSGPTGFVALSAQDREATYESYLVTGMCAPDGATLAIGALEYRNFMQQCRLRSLPRYMNFRNRELVECPHVFEAGFSTEKIPLPDRKLELPALYLRASDSPWNALRARAVAIGRLSGARLEAPSDCHWCSWYDRGRFLRLDELVDFLEGVQHLNEPIQAVQIDDGHQRHHGDWLEPNEALWPGGLARISDEILKRGFNPGVWIGPYMVDSRSRLYREHPDWVLHDCNGDVFVSWKNYHGTHESQESYILDTSHPDAFAYIRQVFRQLRQWGFKFFKTDFVEWGWKDSTTVRRNTPGKTAAQYHDDVARMIREEIGPDAYWLVCIGYFAPYVGYADGMRVSSDTGPRWLGGGGTGNDGVAGGIPNVISEIYNCQFFNNVLYQNDPDVLFFRDVYNHLTEDEVKALAFYIGIMGVSINTSDRLDQLPPNRLSLWRFIEPQAERWTATLPFWGEEKVLLTAVRVYPELGTWAAVLFNPTEHRQLERYSVKRLIGHNSAYVYDWDHEGSKSLGKMSEIVADLPARHARLFYFAMKDTRPPADLSLGGAVYRRT